MKVRIEIDDSLNEDEIVIRTKEYTEELQQLISNFKSKPSIQFFKQDTEYYLDLDAILFFESDNGRVYAHTANDMFFTTQKLYELENILPNSFLRISKSTIVNIQKFIHCRILYRVISLLFKIVINKSMYQECTTKY